MAHKEPAYQAQASGTYQIKEWDEKTWDGRNYTEQSGAKLTHAKVKVSFEGDLQGEGVIQGLMSYSSDHFASFVEFQQITGRLGDRSGSFVVRVVGVYEDGTASSTWSVVPGSGTGELRGLRGEGSSVARHQEKQPFTLNYSIDG